jgi:hypothetical protein
VRSVGKKFTHIWRTNFVNLDSQLQSKEKPSLSQHWIRTSSFRKRFSILAKSGIHFSWRNTCWWARASSLLSIHDHTQTQDNQLDSCGRAIGQSQMPSNRQTDIHATGENGTRLPSNRAATDLRLDCVVTAIGTNSGTGICN